MKNSVAGERTRRTGKLGKEQQEITARLRDKSVDGMLRAFHERLPAIDRLIQDRRGDGPQPANSPPASGGGRRPCLVIRGNVYLFHINCPLCGEITDSRRPYEINLAIVVEPSQPEIEWHPVCRRYAEEHALYLSRMLNAWYMVGGDIAHHCGTAKSDPDDMPF